MHEMADTRHGLTSRIHQLLPQVANQIAAGEVIERPASVVKELLENALDAKATSIQIDINYGGLNLIKVSDDGIGIVAEDLPLAIAAHATSKIRTLNDLYAIDTMGFRGEALASIASVSKLTIISKPKEQSQAMMLTTSNGAYQQRPSARADGTTIEVADLFYNAPVRKRFLKSERIEFQAVEAIIKRFALSAPSIAISLTHNNKLIFSLQPALSQQSMTLRMAKLLGSAFASHAVYVDVAAAGMRLYGWISGFGFQRSQSDKQWMYLNRRMIKDKLLFHAIRQVYEGYLHPGRFPGCLLYLSIDAGEVDVNVHPTKHEVRFQQPRLVHDFLVTQLTQALTVCQQEESAQVYSLPEQREMSQFVRHDIDDWGDSEKPFKLHTDGHPTVLSEPSSIYPLPDTRGKAEPSLYKTKITSNTNKQWSQSTDNPWMMINTRYAVYFAEQKSYVVDVLYLYKKWLQEYLSKEKAPLVSRPLLVPVRCSLSHTAEVMSDVQQALSSIGITVRYKDNQDVVVQEVPVLIPYLDLHGFIAQFDIQQQYTFPQLIDLACQSIAIDVSHLSMDEKIQLSHYFSSLIEEEPTSLGLYKALTTECCKAWLHA